MAGGAFGLAEYKTGELSSLFSKPKDEKNKKGVEVKADLADVFQKSVKKPKKSKNPSTNKEQNSSKPEPKSNSGQLSDKKKKPNQAKKSKTIEDDAEKTKRTVFVGNVPLVNKVLNKLKKLFEKSCGPVESVRLRSVPIKASAIPSNAGYKVMRKVSVNKGNFDTEAGGENTCSIAYVVFKTKQDAENAVTDYGTKSMKKETLRIGDHILRVDSAASDEHNRAFDRRRTVFVGSLPFKTSENAVTDFFCSKIITRMDGNKKSANGDNQNQTPVEAVRLIRDQATNMCKGIGYVLLRSPDLLEKALAINGKTFDGRKLRVSRCERSERLKRKNDKKTIAPQVKSNAVSALSKSNSSKFEGLRSNANLGGAKLRLRKKKKNQILQDKNGSNISKRKRVAQKESRKERQARKKQKKERK
uniref:RRM domain-containing protein n=1 Tax=Aplanochytrium stocchinoi TaxID=215587 RepID=A0A7S3V2B8_9STRA|mmetsp:Transcript_30861/g.38098  ORF Transcript_30861/g.38098 Transcript_30861/m.38098 type:complete len:416 (+) Transcript_30861:214-1461(+)|eukprot:CAMPEP_0204835984 /NCGR_PEP_ID=MMETSP1346-20131115/24185_1 /ASSEMBLY_ACC=CAM_ASM_000771 /TAXON_ID=215587 /ORGANISM="Aplanochytrium stocchinoi, Strain GSBS06" /LENGTH=415 /DNA_ID=CAMNT_0051970439 /DNA_START=151 /DNA_END=1398 /DNA_ORIENTATION=-